LDKEGLHPIRTWKPLYRHETNWEKNWGFFGNAGELWCLYSISPFVVLHMYKDEALPFSDFAWQQKWIGGHMRGGAPPMEFGDEYYSFFHGALDHEGYPTRTYSVGCVVWPKRPPWRPRRYTPVPIMVPPEAGWPRELGVSVVFPGGAVRRGDRWILSVGVHDAWCHIVEVDAQELEKAMVEVC
jgi:predicted GH43/DUF377 family glycosyl hydrolase